MLTLIAALLLAPALQLPTQAGTPQAGAPPRSAPVELKDQTVCPVGGEAVDKKVFADYEGQRVYFCSKECVAKYQGFPDKYLFQMYGKGERPENVQTICPVSGEKLEKKETCVEVLNLRIYTCCEKCAAKVKADPVQYLDVLEGRKPQSVCPVSGEPVDGKDTVVVQGQKVALCCPKCAEELQKDPDKYFAEVARSKAYTVPAESQCPIMDKPIESKNYFVTYQGRRIYFCCKKCLSAFTKNPEQQLQKS